MVISKIISVCFLVITMLPLAAQDMSLDGLQLTVDNDSIFYDAKRRDLWESIPISLTFGNRGKQELQTIALGAGVSPGRLRLLSDYCDKRGVGILFAVYDKHGKELIPGITIIDELNQKPMTTQRFDSVLRSGRIEFFNSTRVLHVGEKVSYTQTILLDDFDLLPGVYYLQLLYYCGGRIFDSIKAGNVKRLTEKVFQGCVLSQKVPLIVR